MIRCILSQEPLQVSAMQTAFKEWTVVVDSLARGEQIVILRKGGIREGKAGFQVASDSFWLFPTQFHQQREAVTNEAQLRYDEIRRESPDENVIQVRSLAKVVEHVEVDDWDRVSQLDRLHIWREEIIKDRFEWGEKQAIFALVVRLYQLPAAVKIPMLPKYGGCRSWVELEPHMPMEGLKPVVEDESFSEQLQSFHDAIQQ
ncbi:MAG: DUF1802 family protein [Verrucomicrobia bacterium]|nr:DUF1802 family protein [Verrucomicrobiota bacterium]